MDKKKDDMPDWLAIPLIGIGLAIWYAWQSPENYKQVMDWVNVAADIIKWATEPQADIPVQAAAPAIVSTGLSAIGQIGFLIGIVMIAFAVIATFSGKLGGKKDSTLQGSPTDEPFDKAASLARKQLASAVGPVVGPPKQRTSLLRSGSRLVR